MTAEAATVSCSAARRIGITLDGASFSGSYAISAARPSGIERVGIEPAQEVLPGPTGESNTLYTWPRGVVLCLGPDTASAKQQAADQAMFRHLGVEPAEQDILALKSSVHFRADFQPIAEATATGFISPLFVTGLSVIFLGEKVGLRRWSATKDPTKSTIRTPARSPPRGGGLRGSRRSGGRRAPLLPPAPRSAARASLRDHAGARSFVIEARARARCSPPRPSRPFPGRSGGQARGGLGRGVLRGCAWLIGNDARAASSAS